MKNIDDNREFGKVGAYIKAIGFLGGAKTGKESDDGLAQVETSPVTASEQRFLDSYAT